MHCLDIFKIYQYLKSNLNPELLSVSLFTWKDKCKSRSGVVLFCSSISILFVLACVVLILCFSSTGPRHPLYLKSSPRVEFLWEELPISPYRSLIQVVSSQLLTTVKCDLGSAYNCCPAPQIWRKKLKHPGTVERLSICNRSVEMLTHELSGA